MSSLHSVERPKDSAEMDIQKILKLEELFHHHILTRELLN